MQATNLKQVDCASIFRLERENRYGHIFTDLFTCDLALGHAGPCCGWAAEAHYGIADTRLHWDLSELTEEDMHEHVERLDDHGLCYDAHVVAYYNDITTPFVKTGGHQCGKCERRFNDMFVVAEPSQIPS